MPLITKSVQHILSSKKPKQVCLVWEASAAKKNYTKTVSFIHQIFYALDFFHPAFLYEKKNYQFSETFSRGSNPIQFLIKHDETSDLGGIVICQQQKKSINMLISLKCQNDLVETFFSDVRRLIAMTRVRKVIQ